MSIDQLNELIECFKSVKDPRVQGRSKHLFIDIIVISVCAILCGAEGITDIEVFSVSKRDWLEKHLELPNGIPSYDTIARVLSIVNAEELEKAFLTWIESITSDQQTKRISIDGKCSNGTERRFRPGTGPLKIVSVYSHDLNLSLVEKRSDEVGETEAAISCLEMLELKDVLVSVDAGIGNHKVVERIREKEGHYLVPLKANQHVSRNEVENELELNKVNIKIALSDEVGHGRGEQRECSLLTAAQMSDKFMAKWPDAKSVFSILRLRLEEDKRYTVQETNKNGTQSYRINKDELRYNQEIMYYVSSKKMTAKQALIETRKHWEIENKVHWVLDVAFREDDWSVRAKSLAKTLSLIRKIALNIIRRSNTQGSIRVRMKKAAWSEDFLEKLLFG